MCLKGAATRIQWQHNGSVSYDKAEIEKKTKSKEKEGKIHDFEM